MECRSCGGAVPAAVRRCPHCLTPVRDSFLWRLIRLFTRTPRGGDERARLPRPRRGSRGAGAGGLPPEIQEGVRRSTVSRRSRRGDTVTLAEVSRETHTYDSLDDLPPHLRDRVEDMLAGSADEAHSTVYTFRGPDGVERTYHSLDEMPPDVRARFERPRD